MARQPVGEEGRLKLTNRLDLPETIVRAVSNDPYSMRGSRISATSLYGAPKPRVLRQRHGHEITEDVADRLWALVGQIGHGILERAMHKANPHEVLEEIREVVADARARWTSADNRLALISSALKDIWSLIQGYFYEYEEGDVVERRLFMNVAGWTVSGQLDIYRGKRLKIQDYKFTSVYTWVMGGRTEWVYQMNTYAQLLRANGSEPDEAEIVLIFRDWKKAEAANDPAYPQQQVIVLPIELWPAEQAIAWIEERVRVHQLAELTPTEDLPDCTDEERWVRGNEWVVMRDGQRRAVASKGIASEQDALDFIAAKVNAGKGDGLHAQFRPGRPLRCEHYCNVNSVCSQWKKSYHSLLAATPAASETTPEQG